MAGNKIRDKLLFTPGPLTCSAGVKEAMLRDLGSRDSEFIDLVKQVRAQLLTIAGVNSNEFAAILMQGSGTFSVEATIQTFVPKNGGKVLLLINGAYGRRLQTICDYLAISVDVLEFPEDTAVEIPVLRIHLMKEGPDRYCAVCVVHCETSSGVVNPVQEVAEAVRELQPGAAIIVDAMSSFGAIPLSLDKVDAVVSSANKCLQGVPGLAFIIVRKSALSKCKGNARSLSLDLVSQLAGLEGDGQFRFTPPTHAVLAFHQALREFWEEGGLTARAARYKRNCAVVQDGLTKLGIKKLLRENDGYIITSFRFPDHPNFNFEEFYRRLSDLGLVIYPGKVTKAPCFRIGHIGALFEEDMRRLVTSTQAVLRIMGVLS